MSSHNSQNPGSNPNEQSVNLGGKTVVFTEESIKRFEQTYDEANVKHVDRFVFDGNEYVTGYAVYLLEYLKDIFDEEVTS